MNTIMIHADPADVIGVRVTSETVDPEGANVDATRLQLRIGDIEITIFAPLCDIEDAAIRMQEQAEQALAAKTADADGFVSMPF